MRFMATWFSDPRGIITSAYFLVGSVNSSNAGFTHLVFFWIFLFKFRNHEIFRNYLGKSWSFFLFKLCFGFVCKKKIDNKPLIISKDLIKRSIKLLHVAANTPGKSSVRVAVHKQLHLTEVSDLGVVEYKNALNYEHVNICLGFGLVGLNFKKTKKKQQKTLKFNSISFSNIEDIFMRENYENKQKREGFIFGKIGFI